MRILFVSFVNDTRATGMGKWTHCVQEELRRRGHQTTAWFSEDFPLLNRYERLSVLAFPPLLAAKLHRARRDFDLAVVHEPSGFWHGLAGRIFPQAIPMLSICHNVESNVFRQMIAAEADGATAISLTSRIKAAFASHWQSFGAMRFADHVVCLSTLDRKYLIERIGLPSERITHVVNGVDLVRFSPSRDSVADSKRVIFVGGWHDIKGARLLPAIWQRVRRRVADARLTIVGVGSAEDQVRRIFAPIGGVEVVANVANEEDMAALYRQHGVFVLPSLSEGSPLSALEAMACGLAVVMTRVGGVPDIVEDGKSGLLFPVGDAVLGSDALLRVITDPALTQTLSRAAVERAQSLSWERAAALLECACFAAVSARVA